MSAIDERMLAQWRLEIMERGLRPQTCHTYATKLASALRLAHELRLIPRVPAMPRSGVKSGKSPRGRPLSTRECWAVLRACRAVRPRDWRRWARYYHLPWLSGLRCSEAVALAWDEGPVRLDLEAKYPCLVFQARGQKSRKEERVPITPEFSRWLQRTPPAERVGKVCQLPTTQRTVLRAMFRLAGVVVNRETGQRASSHDFRRTFGTRMSYRGQPLTLKALMRHADIQTTLKYYVHQDVDKVAAALWGD